MHRSINFQIATLAIVSLASQGYAAVTDFTNRATFESQGAIAHNSTFDDFGDGFTFVGDPFTRGGVTYHSTMNLTWGSFYTSTTETLIGNELWTPISGSLNDAAKYDMFGFDIGMYGSGSVTFEITTSADTYSFTAPSIADSSGGHLEFRGFIANSGEYITGFNIIANAGMGTLPGITYVTVGRTPNAPHVPDSGGALGLLLLATTAIGLFRKSVR